MKNLYETLGVSKTASQNDIKRAYRRLAMKNHPDMGGDTATFQEIDRAYRILKDEEKRRQYDETGKTESSKEETSEEDLFREWAAKNVFTNTSVDEFVPGYPNFFSRSDEFEDPETGDIPWSSQDVKIMKWERARTMFENQIKLLNEYLGDLTKAPYEELMSPEKLIRLLVGLRQDKFIGTDEYDHAIDLIDDYEAEWESLQEHIVELKRRENMHEKQDSLENHIVNKLIKPMSGADYSLLVMQRANKRKGNDKKFPKDNEEVAKLREDGKIYPWVDKDKRQIWRDEKNKIDGMGGPGGLK
jgi:curved DNA-binding protein CbpA